MRYKEPKPMREIHRIQEKLYEEEKNLSTKELVEKINCEAEQAIKKYGLKTKHVRKVA